MSAPVENVGKRYSSILLRRDLMLCQEKADVCREGACPLCRSAARARAHDRGRESVGVVSINWKEGERSLCQHVPLYFSPSHSVKGSCPS